MAIPEKFKKPSRWDIGVGRKFGRQDGEDRTAYLSRMAEVIPAAPGPVGVNVYSLPVREMAREVVDLRAEVIALRAEINEIQARLGSA
jgi:hypothetical protein